LRKKALDPNTLPAQRQALLQAAAAADQVQQTGSAQVQAGVAPPNGGRPAGGGPVLNKKSPDATTLKTTLETDQAINNLGDLITKANSPAMKEVSGGLFTNPVGAAKQWGANLPAMIRPSGSMGLTPEQAAYNAQLSQTITSIRKALFGVRVTKPELVTLAPAVPEGPTDPYLIPKLTQWQKFMQEHRDDINNAMDATRRQVVPQRTPSGQPAAAAPPPGLPSAGASGPKVWTRDPSGKLIPQ
jgi:hypothetical protein